MLEHDHIIFFFNETATTEIYTLSLHDALPISLELDELQRRAVVELAQPLRVEVERRLGGLDFYAQWLGDRKSTRLNSSHDQISYAVFCLKKKNTNMKSRCNIQPLKASSNAH